MAQSLNPFNIATGEQSVPHPCCSQAFEIASAHLPEEDWEELQVLVETADTAQLQFECFTMPDSDAMASNFSVRPGPTNIWDSTGGTNCRHFKLCKPPRASARRPSGCSLLPLRLK